MNFIKKYLFEGSERTKVIKKNILGSFGIKGLSILTSLILVPFTINILDKEKYGIWITIFSIVSWFNMMDVGLGNGFRNKFAESFALNNKALAKDYLQTFYSSIAIIALCLLTIFTFINPFLNWKIILNLPNSFNENISLIVWSVFALFCLQLYLKNISTVLLSLQKTTISDSLFLLGNIGSLIIIFVLKQINQISLFSIALAFMVSPIFVNFSVNLYAFLGPLKQYKPKLFALPIKKYLNELVGLGLKFFFIQITCIIMYSSSNIIITQLYGPSEVTPYNVAFRFYSSIQVLFTIIIAPFWSAFTEAHTKQDYKWINRSLKRLIVIWITYAIVVVILWLASPIIFKIWIGSKVNIPITLSFQFALFVIINSWSSIFSFFVAGIGKISLSLYGAIFQFIVNIPLAIFFARNLNLGTAGIIMATNINLLIPAIFLAIQTRKIINKQAYGIWNK